MSSISLFLALVTNFLNDGNMVDLYFRISLPVVNSALFVKIYGNVNFPLVHELSTY